METLPVPGVAEAATSLFGNIFSSVVQGSGSTLLGYVVVTVMVFSLAFLLWTVGNWLYNLFIDRKEKQEREIKYYDAVGNPINIVTP